MTVDVKRLPTLRVLQSYGPAVVAAKIGVNHWDARKRNTLPFYGIYFLPLVKAFQKAHNIPATGVVGPVTWAALMPHLNSAARALLPQVKPKPLIPNLGPVYAGGKSVLAHDCTHATDGIPLYPAFDDAYTQGTTIIAPEALTVTRSSSSRPGQAFYCTGASGIRYWFGHLDRTHAAGSTFKKGTSVGRVAPNHVGGGPHVHVGVNVENLWGKGRQLSHHTNYTHGAPTIGSQLAVRASV